MPYKSGPGSNHGQNRGLGMRVLSSSRVGTLTQGSGQWVRSPTWLPQSRAHVQCQVKEAEVALTFAGITRSAMAHVSAQRASTREGVGWALSGLCPPPHHLLPGRDIQSGAGDGSHSSSKMQFLSFSWNKWYSLSRGG